MKYTEDLVPRVFFDALSPKLKLLFEEILEEGMVFTIEPGIYLSDEFGVRIEDTIVMQNGRGVIL